MTTEVIEVYKLVKRLLDIIGSLAGLIILSPVMLITAVLVKRKLGSPVIFTQQRAGRHGKVFKLYKFRSMTNERDENGELLPNKERMTKFGRLLRSTSMDEVPEMINILKGDMSFVGPRPLLAEYLEIYSEEQMKRHNVKPGLTGYTAVNGRASLSWEEKFEMDVWYVNNVSFLLDLKIFIKTFTTVLKRKDITGERGRFTGDSNTSDKQ